MQIKNTPKLMKDMNPQILKKVNIKATIIRKYVLKQEKTKL